MAESLTDKLARLRAEREAQEPRTPPQFPADLIPEVEHGSHPPDELDRAFDDLDILDAYNRWIGKAVKRHSSKAREIQVSCPLPGHPDANPSASINLDKQVWDCYACSIGGDKYDLAAIGLGFPVPGYKSKDQFPKLRQRMAQDLGITIHTTPSGATVAVAAAPPAATAQPLAPVVALPAPPAGDPHPSIDWRAILPEGTFWRNYMEACVEFDLPDEYHFWTGAQLVATACGRDVVLLSNPPVLSNIFVCIVGVTGAGKSRSLGMQRSVVWDALPYDYDAPESTGTYMSAEPGSGEALYDTFSKKILDPTDPKKIIGYAPIRSIVKFNEMSSIAHKAARSGSILNDALINLYDGESHFSVRSRQSGLTVIENPFCQIITTTQPDTLHRILQASDIESGYINRWVFVAGPTKPLDAYREDFFDPKPHVDPLRTIRAWAAQGGKQFRLTGDALTKWTTFFRSELEPIKTDDGQRLLSRSDLTLFKSLLHMAANERSAQITPHHVEVATEIVWPYLRATYEVAGKQIGLGEVDACIEAIIEAISKHKDRYNKQPTITDLHDRYLKHKWNTDIIRKALANGCALERLVEIPPVTGQRGRPSTHYDLTA